MRTDFIELNAARNRETAEQGDNYKSHRDRVMQLIRATVGDLTDDKYPRCAAAVLLGAGNCLDVELPELQRLFEELHLVDVDATALHDAVQKEGVDAQRVQIHAPADIAEPLLSLTSRDFDKAADDPEKLAALLQQLAAENAIADVPEADVVVSLCVLSQLFDALQRLVQPGHPAFAHAVKAVRIGHLRRMLNMLRPGGVGILITDIVSSDTAPELKTTSPEQLPELVRQLVDAKNFFSGTNPAMVLVDLNMLSRLPGGADTVHTIDPWLWQLGDRTYAVYGMRIQKKMPIQEDGPSTESPQ